MPDPTLIAHIREVAETFAPERGPETPTEAVDRLLEYYRELEKDEQYGFVVALVAEVVAGRSLDRARREIPDPFADLPLSQEERK